ncbi:hypothetical protein EJ05DRAFT_470796 [Pseudovirgaria hyperparasitica]|uniref:F-box domain-containing protein n=1 Tax=Pseudovirgaria hyperparasitica TaxID=470096 RepID=A0A6A6VS46_9PEZI|nr:uncharacterized protein EJ05DRAFT_470796 [Pseudovirgaria hyperparasitica]KAF2753033.1 hypothetical protein EJ05DRAFT_470796 [Pseudovirgaria hyperparasitica]
MQSEPQQASQNIHTEQPTPSTSEASQHGLHPEELSALHLSLDGDDARAHQASSSHHDDVAKVTSVEAARVVASVAQEETRLKRTPSPPSNRISDYEAESASSTPLRTCSEGRSFEVVKKLSDSVDDKSYIDKLPNEVLTHAISHLSPTDLSAVALVSRRFHSLVTTPHAWRAAFGRYFPGAEELRQEVITSSNGSDIVPSGKRAFTRLTALASWRSEYILRTRLLRSLARGKPVRISATPANARAGQQQNPVPMTIYNSQLFTTVNHMHAVFGTGLNKRMPRFIHGADEIGSACCSDPTTVKVDPWGLSDPTPFFQFSDAFPGDSQWGLGAGDIIGVPNVMDVSQPYGMLYGEGHPGCSAYFRATDELRGRVLAAPSDEAQYDIGMPAVLASRECITSVWIAKSSNVPHLSEGLVGMLCGLSCGIISSYSLGTDGTRGRRFLKGETTARWVLSPGVPIIAIAVDDDYSMKRQAQNRIWAVALNALGEIFYLTKFPKLSGEKRRPTDLERASWERGRTTHWILVEPSRRTARVNPYDDASTATGSYTPRSSWDGECLSVAQIRAETREMEEYMKKRPKDFRQVCTGWDMRRRIEVDFAGDDGHYAGESIAVFECGLDEDSVSSIRRFTRCKLEEPSGQRASSPSLTTASEKSSQESSLFGGPSTPDAFERPQRPRRISTLSLSSSPERGHLIEEWRLSTLTFGGLKSVQLTTSAIDSSMLATMTLSEDPIFGFSTMSNASSPFASPQSMASQPSNPADVPGQRARFVAAGTSTGIVLLWDIRAPISKNVEFANTVDPIRIIFTDSPEISCLAITGLYIVHGGNDGLVQAWDPLASSPLPVRTLHSRHSSRARRRLQQAQASVQGVGINFFAAGAICLDPDPTVLRGIVSIGTFLHYWSFSSSAADQYKGSKRRLRRGERGSNNSGATFSANRGGNLKGYIANEKFELELEQRNQRREANRMAGRFGLGLLDNEDEALAYAALLSQESLENEAKRRLSENSVQSNDTVIVPSSSETATTPVNDEVDPEIAEAIRLSLQESSISETHQPYYSSPPTDSSLDSFSIPIKYAKNKRSPKSRAKTTLASNSSSPPAAAAEGSNRAELDDLEYAMQLSLAEEKSRLESVEQNDPFPYLSGGKGKGKM